MDGMAACFSISRYDFTGDGNRYNLSIGIRGPGVGDSFSKVMLGLQISESSPYWVSGIAKITMIVTNPSEFQIQEKSKEEK